MTPEQYRLIVDILSGALEDLECEIDEQATDAYNRSIAHQASLLRPLVDAFAAADVARAITDEEKRS